MFTVRYFFLFSNFEEAYELSKSTSNLLSVSLTLEYNGATEFYFYSSHIF